MALWKCKIDVMRETGARAGVGSVYIYVPISRGLETYYKTVRLQDRPVIFMVFRRRSTSRA